MQMRHPVASLSRSLRPLWRSGGQGAFQRPSPLSTRTIVAAPRPQSGPLLSRRADRELPSVVSQRRWLRSVPVFAVIVVGAALGIFNYQRLSSSVVSSTMFALRRSPGAREALGDEIQFAYRLPWISGEVNQLHGRIDISFWVKGTRATGKMRFKSTRESRLGFFRTENWSLEMEDGRIIPLLVSSEDAPLPSGI